MKGMNVEWLNDKLLLYIVLKWLLEYLLGDYTV